MKAFGREGCIRFIVASLCYQGADADYFRDRLSWSLDGFSDDDLMATLMLSSYQVPMNEMEDKNRLVRFMIISEQKLEIRTIVSNLDEIGRLGLGLNESYLLLRTLREMKVLDSDEEHYPYLKSHVDISRYSANNQIPYHRNEELVRLVHEHPDEHEEIINLIYVHGINNAGLVREHLLNTAPALAEGIL